MMYSARTYCSEVQCPWEMYVMTRYNELGRLYTSESYTHHLVFNRHFWPNSSKHGKNWQTDVHRGKKKNLGTLQQTEQGAYFLCAPERLKHPTIQLQVITQQSSSDTHVLFCCEITPRWWSAWETAWILSSTHLVMTGDSYWLGLDYCEAGGVISMTVVWMQVCLLYVWVYVCVLGGGGRDSWLCANLTLASQNTRTHTQMI